MHEMRHAQSDTGVGGAQTGGLAWSYFPGGWSQAIFASNCQPICKKLPPDPPPSPKNADCPRDQVIVARSGRHACLGMAETNDSAGASLGNTQK